MGRAMLLAVDHAIGHIVDHVMGHAIDQTVDHTMDCTMDDAARLVICNPPFGTSLCGNASLDKMPSLLRTDGRDG